MISFIDILVYRKSQRDSVKKRAKAIEQLASRSSQLGRTNVFPGRFRGKITVTVTADVIGFIPLKHFRWHKYGAHESFLLYDYKYIILLNY